MSGTNDTTIASQGTDDTATAPSMPTSMSGANGAIQNPDPGDIGTSFNSLDPILYTKHIAFQRTTWSSKDAAGKLLFKFRIDPREANWAIRYFTKPYITWSGGMCYQIRIGGTGFNGGKIMAVYLPPPLDPDEYSVDDLTTFDHELMDPKTLDGKQVLASDSKTVLAHWNQQDINDSLFGRICEFGGHVIVVVFIELIGSSEDNSTLTLVALNKLAADFRVSGLKPPPAAKIFSTVPSIVFPKFPTYTNQQLNFNNTHPVIQYPIKFMHVGGTTYGHNASWVYPRNGEVEAILFRQSLLETAGAGNVVIGAYPQSYKTLASKRKFKWVGQLTGVGGGVPFKIIYKDVTGPEVTLQLNSDFGNGVQHRANPAGFDDTGTCVFGERIIRFASDKGDLYGPTTCSWVMDLVKTGIFNQEIASDLLFQIYDSELEIPLSYVRMNEEGVFSCNVAENTYFEIPKCYLRYVSSIPKNGRLPRDPPESSSYVMMLRAERALDLMALGQNPDAEN